VAQAVGQLCGLGQQQLCSGDGVDRGSVCGVPGEAEVASCGVQAQRIGGDVPVRTGYEAVLELHGVHCGDRQPRPVHRSDGVGEEAELEGRVVRHENATAQRLKQLRQCITQA
jgi:hypothetical protein